MERQEVKEKEEAERRQQRLSKRNGDLTEKRSRGGEKRRGIIAGKGGGLRKVGIAMGIEVA